MQRSSNNNGKRMFASADDPAHSTALAPHGNADKRGEPRRNIRAECKLWLFLGSEPSARHAAGVARNLSFKGIAVVSDVAEPIPPGRPVEVVVDTPEGSQTYAAGTVVYCSMISAGCFEFGIKVEAAGADPILIGNPVAAKKSYDWFAEALKVPH